MCSFVPSLKTSRPGTAVGHASLWATHQEPGTGCPPGTALRGDTQQQPQERAGVASRTPKEARASSRTPPCGCTHSSNQLARPEARGRRLWRWEQP